MFSSIPASPMEHNFLRLFHALKRDQELVGNERGEHIELTDNVRLAISWIGSFHQQQHIAG
jgi:hypothetical protein